MTRIEKLWAEHTGCEAFLIAAPENLRYLTGYTGDSAAALLLPGKTVFLTDFRYIEQAERQTQGVELCMVSGKELLNQAVSRLKNSGLKNVGVDGGVSAREYAQLFHAHEGQISFVEDALLRLRAIKTPEEIQKIRQGARDNDEFFQKLLSILKPGISENDLRAELYYWMNKKGYGIAFDAIIASGKNSSLPHAGCSDKIVEAGDFVTFDFGCKVDGYCSDFTRTVAVGSVSKAQKEIYETVLCAQQAAYASFVPGMRACKLDAAAREVIAQAGYGAEFGHGLGHGVGLDIHEWPTVNSASDIHLEEGMVLTLEPGIYLKGRFGVRIEDSCVVEDGALKSMSAAPKQLLVV